MFKVTDEFCFSFDELHVRSVKIILVDPVQSLDVGIAADFEPSKNN